MPARPRIPDPRKGALEKFAFDLRQLGVGKVGVSWIAAQEDTEVSRPALYAALSGTRLPNGITVSTLLRWWAGNPDEENPDVQSRDWIWGWIPRLPAGSDAHTQANEWKQRYLRLSRAESQRRSTKNRSWKPTPPVQIDTPREQHLLIEEIKGLIERTGLSQDVWLLFGPETLRIERYLSGRVIPHHYWTFQIVNYCADFIPDLHLSEEVDRLNVAAEIARRARVRERRIARNASPARRGRG
ncbi:hypothetical protein ACIQ9K_38805 [Streptomyces microflavus]|uniref:hypothetical protein n=1 Tax=Streptomyces microflavus TaxID=1919 RepID=UPI00382CA759